MIYDDEAEQAGAGDHHGATGDPAAFVSRADPPPPVDDPRPPYDGQPRDHEQPPDGRLASDGGQPRGARPPVDGWFADAEAASDEGTAPDDRLAADDEPAADESADARPEDDGLAADDDGSATGGELEKAEDLGLGEAERALLEWAMRRQTAAGEPLLPVAGWWCCSWSPPSAGSSVTASPTGRPRTSRRRPAGPPRSAAPESRRRAFSSHAREPAVGFGSPRAVAGRRRARGRGGPASKEMIAFHTLDHQGPDPRRPAACAC